MCTVLSINSVTERCVMIMKRRKEISTPCAVLGPFIYKKAIHQQLYQDKIKIFKMPAGTFKVLNRCI